MNMLRRWRVIAVAITLLLTLVAPQPLAADAASTVSLSTLRSRLIYFVRADRGVDRALTLTELDARSDFEADLWRGFLSAWDTANSAQKLNYSPPKDLPTSGHVFIVLGGSLSSKGNITTQVINRLKVALAALSAYPNSKVLVSGGAPKNGHTEAERMREWLIDNGIKSGRIISEAKSSSTVGNANESIAILKTMPSITSYTLISDASHIRRASVLFNAAVVKVEVTTGKHWGIRQIKNVAYKDKTITNPPNDQTMSVIASNVASVWGITSNYKAVIADPPAPAKLTSLSVKPTKTTYPVGSNFSRSDLVATAVYNDGKLPVTNAVKISGFDASKVGKPTINVAYTSQKVTKKASFSVSVVKASGTARVTASTTKPKRKKTKVVLTVKLSSATGVLPTGTVRIMLGSKVLTSVTFDRDDKGKRTIKLPVFTATGSKKLTISYQGSSTVTSAKTSLKVTVKR